MASTTSCVFCGRRNPRAALTCAGCNGPLQPEVGADPGPPPPPAPRAIASSWVVRQVLSFPVVFGALFGGIPFVVGSAMLVAGIASLLVPLVLIGGVLILSFGAIGGVTAAVGIGEARRRLRVLRAGRPAVATIVSCAIDRSQSSDGVSPWWVQYVFEVDGRPAAGAAHLWDASASRFTEGDRLHVVYDVDEPSRNLPWPPP